MRILLLVLLAAAYTAVPVRKTSDKLPSESDDLEKLYQERAWLDFEHKKIEALKNDIAQDERLEKYIHEKMAEANIPSLSTVVLHKDTVMWQKAYGYANPVAKPPRPATVDTTYLLASISKTLMATTLMTLYDKGLFRLDDSINNYIDRYPKAGFNVVNPYFIGYDITFRMLLTHTSSISDKPYLAQKDKRIYTRGSDSPLSLLGIMHRYFKGGWSENHCFLKRKPGHKFKYSNIGAALAGFMVEVLTGEDFAVVSNRHVIVPLGNK